MKHRHKGKYRSRTPKGKIVRKRRPLHKKTYVVYKRPPSKLSKDHRSIFQKLDRKPYEVGGYMDFNLKGLERADVYIGRTGSVDIPLDADSEVDYHTHPKDKDTILNRANAFPSKWDIKTFKEYPSQSMIIFHNNKAMVTTKTDKFKVDNKLLNKIDRNLSKDGLKMNVEQLHKTSDQSEILIPIGGGTFLNGTLTDHSKVLVDIGAGLVTEKTVDDAVKKINERITALKENLEKLMEMAQKLQNEATDLSQRTQQMIDQVQG